MTRDATPGPRRAELYVRSLRPVGYCRQQSSVLDRLAGLEERGVISEWNVQVCGCQVPATRQDAKTAVGQRLVDQLTAFREWAIANDRALTPTFEIREVDNELTDTQYRAVRLPAMLLAEYRAGELVCVTPHRDGTTVHAVADRVADLEAGDPTTFQRISYTETDAAESLAAEEGRDTEEPRLQLPQR